MIKKRIMHWNKRLIQAIAVMALVSVFRFEFVDPLSLVMYVALFCVIILVEQQERVSDLEMEVEYLKSEIDDIDAAQALTVARSSGVSHVDLTPVVPTLDRPSGWRP